MNVPDMLVIFALFILLLINVHLCAKNTDAKLDKIEKEIQELQKSK